ncbi:MAG: YybH family protein [Gemmatimonadota bacterium]
MRRLITLTCAAVLALPLTAVAQKADKEAIQAKIEAWAAAWNAGDGAAIGALYAADALILPPGSEPVKGAAAIGDFWSAAIAEAGGSTVELKTHELIVHGDLAVERGGFVDTAADGSHGDHGKYVVVWKKTDDGWKITRDIWNSSMTP